jgi:hypothetical protein
LIHGTFRMMNEISAYCYYPSSGLMNGTAWWFNASTSPYRFSDA